MLKLRDRLEGLGVVAIVNVGRSLKYLKGLNFLECLHGLAERWSECRVFSKF